MPWQKGGRVDSNYQVDVPFTTWVEVPETPFVALIRMLLRKPQVYQVITHQVRVTCGLEPKTSPNGVKGFTLWMTPEEARPLLNMGVEMSIAPAPISRCYSFDVRAEGLNYQPLRDEEPIEFQPELVPDGGQSMLLRLGD